MRIDERVVGDVTVLTLIGDATLSAASDVTLRDRINSLIQQGRLNLVLDLQNLGYVDSAGNGMFVWVLAVVRNQGGKVAFCNLTKKIKDLWTITKLLTAFDTYNSLDDAIRSFGTPQLEVACPMCSPVVWIGCLDAVPGLVCAMCDVRFRVNFAFSQASSTSAVTTGRISRLSWVTYFTSSYGHEGVSLAIDRASTIAIAGRLDLFVMDVVRTAWLAVPRPRRVVFDTTAVTISSPVGAAQLKELCSASEDGSRGVILVRRPGQGRSDAPAVDPGRDVYDDRDRAIAALGDLSDVPQSLEVSVRRRMASHA